MLSKKMTSLKFKENRQKSIHIDAIISDFGIDNKQDIDIIRTWVKSRFAIVHNGVFAEKPIYCYNFMKELLELVQE